MWKYIARIILRKRVFVLSFLFLFVAFMAMQISGIKLSYKEASLLPKDDIVNVNNADFKRVFPSKNNLVFLGIKLNDNFSKEKLKKWVLFHNKIQNYKGVSSVLGIHNIKKLIKNKVEKKFELRNIIKDFSKDSLKEKLSQFPIYRDIVFDKDVKSLRMLVSVKAEIINSKERKSWVKGLQNEIEIFEKQSGIDVKLSGMPIIRTLNSMTILSEVRYFLLLSLAVTLTVFFLFFRSFVATIISMFVVVIGVVLTFSTIGFFGFSITALTAVIPPLIIVIGIPNCIFIINKYQQGFSIHSNKVKSLAEVVYKVGNATFLTNLTTAFGFFTFMFTDSDILREFGLVASINIMMLFVVSIVMIPTIYSFLPEPKPRHLKHLDKKWTLGIMDVISNFVHYKRSLVYVISFIFFVVSLYGISHIYTSGNVLDDLPKGKQFYKDIKFFDDEFSGVLPIEIMVNAKKKKSINKLSTQKRIDKFQKWIAQNNLLSSPISVVNLSKMTKQAYYNNNPKYYKLPSSSERNFMYSYVKNSTSENKVDFMKNYVDSLGQKARITTTLKNTETGEMQGVFDDLNAKLKEIFPQKKYETYVTGGAYIFFKGTKYLVKNLMISLLIAIVVISVFMSLSFKSLYMILISLIPNLLPLVIVGGIMGFVGIPIKPSTILVFSIAFGISVDDTIHFLAKYRQELKARKWNVTESVIVSLKETGPSMFYTSIVLFFGFLVFTMSEFGGTIALGGLVSITLLIAMMTNLILLPALILTFKNKLDKS